MIKQIILLFICFQSSVLLSQASKSSEVQDSTNIYVVALKLYLENVIDEHVILIEENLFTTKAIPKKLLGFDIQFLTSKQIQKMSRKNEIHVCRITPIRFEDGLFFINVIPFKVKSKRRKIKYINKGGLSVKFKYDCSNNMFSVIDLAM